MQVQLVHLQVFVALTETRSVTAAAARLHLAPSRVSERIRELESVLGASLVDRTTRPAGPTSAGAALLPHARRIVGELATIDAMFRIGADHPLRVGLRSLPAQWREEFVDGVLRPVAGRTSLSVRPLDSIRQVELLRARELDLGLVWNRLDDDDLEQLPVLAERFVIALPDTPRFHRLERVAPADVVGLRLAVNIDPWTFPADLHAYLEMLPLVDRVDAAIEDGLRMLLADGTHCSFLPASWHDHSNFSGPEGERILLRPLQEPEPVIVTYLTWRADRRDESSIGTAVDRARRRYEEPSRR